MDVITRLNRVFAAVGGWSFDHRWWVLALALLVLAGSIGLVSRVQVDASYEAYFDPDDPTYLSYERYRADFGSDEVSYILYDAPGVAHGPWDLDVMRRIVGLTTALEDEVPFVYEVRSLASAELMVGSEDGIEIRELRDHLPDTQEALLELRERYLSKPLLVGGLLSADASYAAILIEMDRSSTDPLDEIRHDPEAGDALGNLYPQVTHDAIEAILARPEYAGIRFYHSGDVPLNTAYNVIIAEESALLTGVTSLVIALILLAFFRSAVGMLTPIVVVQLGVVVTISFMVLVGWKLDLSFSSIPTLLTAIGVAHSVHILSEFRIIFHELGDRRRALEETLYLVGTPCLLASLTTATGFLSMSAVPIKSISHLGVYAAFGVMTAFFLSLTLLMALLSFGRPEPRRRDASNPNERLRSALAALARFTVRRRVSILGGSALIVAASLVGIARMVVDSNWFDDFSDRVPLKAATFRIDEVMGGIGNLILLFDGGGAETVTDPAVLRDIARVQAWADERELVRKSYSIVDILEDLNQTFHADDPAWHRLPDSRALVAQYLLLYESAGGTETDQYLSSDYRNAALELRLGIGMISETASLVELLEAELESRPLASTTLSITGINALWIKLLDYIVSSQIQSFLTAFAVIAAMVCLLFRSLKIGAIAMVPNLAPVVLTLGVMGYSGIPLDYNKVAIAAVAMGIAVDDTIHLLTRYRHEFWRCGDYRVALDTAMQSVGQALLITSLALIAGFLVLLLSVLDSQATQGVLLAVAIASALVADYLLLPALVMTLQPFGPEGNRRGGLRDGGGAR